MPNKVVELEAVRTSYGLTRALDDVSLVVDRGEYVVIAGANGSGKSTLIRALLGSLPYRGKISLFGTPLNRFLAWSKVGYVPQKMFSFNPLFPASVEEVVSLGLLSGKKFMKRLNNEDKHLVAEVLKELRIEDLRHKQIQALSGGQLQRVFIARALVAAPELLVLDEPTSSLDALSRANLFGILRHLNQDHGVTILLISHDVSDLCNDASRLIYLDNKVVFDGGMAAFCSTAPKGSQLGGIDVGHLFHHHHTEGSAT